MPASTSLQKLSGPQTSTAAPVRHRGAFIEMLISSLLSLTASLVLSAEAIRLAAHPLSTSFCDINAKISCSTVGVAWQSSLLGFPNAFLGLIAEPVVGTVAIAALAGVRFPRWFMLAAQAVYTIGLGFAYWLFAQAYFVIHALCPWCLLVTVTTTLVFFSMTRVNVLDGHLRLPARLATANARLIFWVRAGVDHLLAVACLAALAIMVLTRYVL